MKMKWWMWVGWVLAVVFLFLWNTERLERERERGEWDLKRAAWSAELREMEEDAQRGQEVNEKMKGLVLELQRRLRDGELVERK